MADDEIRYDLLTQDALRGVVRQVLARVQREGLPGEHHLYIAFDTGADGVSVSKRSRAPTSGSLRPTVSALSFGMHRRCTEFGPLARPRRCANVRR